MGSRLFSDNALLLFVVALFGALVLPVLFMDGMFVDGVYYAAVSRNYAEGYGTFWNPYFSATVGEMHEQPPLMFALQGLFFKIFGSTLYTERIYCAITALACSAVLLRSWKLLTGTSTVNWLPLLLWSVMPVTFYAFTTNLEECTMTIFVLLAFNCILHALNSPPGNFLYWFIAGAWLLLAGLTKGIQGMFLLSAPFWCWIILKNGSMKHFLLRTASIACIPAAFVLIAWFTPVIHDSFTAYFDSRFGKTFSGITAHTDNRFHILFELLLDSLPVLGLVCIFLVAGRKLPALSADLRQNTRTIFFLLACAFSGILPLMVTLEQRGFYLLTALPLLALAMALTIRPAAEQFARFINAKKTVRTGVFATGIILSLGVVVFTVVNAGKFNRDEEKILALREVAAHTGENIILGVDSAYPDDWALLSYAQRYHHIALTAAEDRRARWILVPKNAAAPVNTTHIPLQSPLFDLYQKAGP